MENTTETKAQLHRPNLAAETLRGDVRDSLLTHVRAIPGWEKLSQDRQQDVITAIDKTAQHVVRGSIKIIAAQDMPILPVRVKAKGKYGEGVIELSASADFTTSNLQAIADHGNGPALLVFAEPGDFFGERRAARAQPDQHSMDLDSEDDGEGENDDGAEVDTRTYAGVLRMVESAPELVGMLFDLSSFSDEDRADLAPKITAKRGKVYLGPEDAADDEVDAQAEDGETQKPVAEAAPKAARRNRRQIRETEAA